MTAILLKSEMRTAVFCKKNIKTKTKNQVLISGMAVSTSYGGQLSRTAVHLSFAGTVVPYAYERTAVLHMLQRDACHRDHNHKC